MRIATPAWHSHPFFGKLEKNPPPKSTFLPLTVDFTINFNPLRASCKNNGLLNTGISKVTADKGFKSLVSGEVYSVALFLQEAPLYVKLTLVSLNPLPGDGDWFTLITVSGG